MHRTMQRADRILWTRVTRPLGRETRLSAPVQSAPATDHPEEYDPPLRSSRAPHSSRAHAASPSPARRCVLLKVTTLQRREFSSAPPNSCRTFRGVSVRGTADPNALQTPSRRRARGAQPATPPRAAARAPALSAPRPPPPPRARPARSPRAPPPPPAGPTAAPPRVWFIFLSTHRR